MWNTNVMLLHNATPASDQSHRDGLSPTSHLDLIHSETDQSPNHTDDLNHTTDDQTDTVQSD